MDHVVVALVDRLRGVAGDEVADAAVRVLHEQLDAERVELYLLDRLLRALHPVAAAGTDVASLAPQAVIDTPAGEAARTDRVLRGSAEGHHITHVPVSIRGERLGVCAITVTDGPERVSPGEELLRRLAATLAVFLLQANSTTDAIECARRSYDYSVTAELQWQLLAPPGLAHDRFRLHEREAVATRLIARGLSPTSIARRAHGTVSAVTSALARAKEHAR